MHRTRRPRRARSLRVLLTTFAIAGLMLLTGTAASAGVDSLAGTVPSFGSQTYGKADGTGFITTASFNDINFYYTVNPYSSSVKAIRCGSLTDLGPQVGYGANDGGERVLAAGVADPTCYLINIASDTAATWDFAAVTRS